MHHIFLSYSRKDSETMQQVKSTLQDAGFSVWTDEGIEPGTPSWKRVIEEAIIGAGCLTCILSPDASQSKWVRAELDFAELHEKPIYLILARGNRKESIPFGYASNQWVDIRTESNYSTHMTRLTNTIQSLTENSVSPDEQSSSNPLLSADEQSLNHTSASPVRRRKLRKPNIPEDVLARARKNAGIEDKK